jgi:hypothetical protein
LLVAALLSTPYRTTVPMTIGEAFWVNSAFIIVPLILAQDARANGFLTQGLALVLAAIVAVAIIASMLKRSVMKLLTWRWGLAGAIAYGFGVFLFFGIYFRLEGDADAVRLIEGRLQPSSSIVLQTRQAGSPVNEQQLLVALARSGGFYLVRQESPAPIAPVVYFVPESEVVTATIRRVDASMATPTAADQHP